MSCQHSNENKKELTTILELPKTSSLPNLAFVNSDLHICWVESSEEEDVLLFKNITTQGNTKEVSRSSDWFVNWADFPGLVGFENGSLLTYWLQKSGEGTYDYDVRMSLSNDQGDSWSDPEIVHNDGVSAEHGFVSSCQYNDDIMMIWLDGREMVNEKFDNDSDHAHGKGAMTLRSAIISSKGKISNRQLVDNKVCECCQTDVVLADCGPIAVYRNRSDKEFRDIYYVRYLNDDWTDPRPLDTISWKINGCPVNGPRIAAKNNIVVATWFTKSDTVPMTRMAISDNCGQSFGDPITIHEGNEVMGRLDIGISENEIVVSSMLQAQKVAQVNIDLFSLDGSLVDSYLVGETSMVRKSGFPRLVVSDKDISISYLDVENDRVILKSLK